MFEEYEKSRGSKKNSPKKLETWRLTQEDIEDGILKLIQLPAKSRQPIYKLISPEQLIKYLVFGTEIFRLSPILLNVKLKGKCIVVGDLHSSVDDLISILYHGDTPPTVEYIFLGDYMGRGNFSLDVLMLVLLLKLRWPMHVHMLRGRHESTEQRRSDEFCEAVLDAYNSKKIIRLFAQMFDYMPLAAIVNDTIFCCHGGISQWLTSREAISNIKRPVVLHNLSHLEGCLVTDLLWADVDSTQEQLFLPSPRGASYVFNGNALRTTLQAIDCTYLVRSNAEVAEGFREDIRNKCFTVYSAHGTAEDEACGFFLQLDTDLNGNVIIDQARDSMEIYRSPSNPADWCNHLLLFIKNQFNKQPCTYMTHIELSTFHSLYKVEETLGEQIVTHRHITHWVLDYGIEALKEIKPKLRGQDVSPNARYFPYYFPILFDVMYGNGKTFRVALNPDEENVVKWMHPPIPPSEWPQKSWDSLLIEDTTVQEERNEKLKEYMTTLN